MSSAAEDGEAAETDASTDVGVPRGREVDHHDPDEFAVRCVDCGVVDREDTRPEAHERAEKHALGCAQTGVTPLARLEAREPEPGDHAAVCYESRRSGGLVQVGGPVVDVDDQSLAFQDRVRSRRIEIDLDGGVCRTDGGRLRLGDLRSLDVVAAGIDPRDDEDEPELRADGSGELLTISDLQREAYEIAEEHGFHDARTDRSTALALIHSEVSEALEADRDPDAGFQDYAEELADIVIRVADHAEEVHVDLEHAIQEKMAENREREYRHGREY